MNLGFILSQMTHVKYFIPLIVEANKRGVDSIMFINPCTKYNSPHRYTGDINRFSKEFYFRVKDINKIKNFNDVVFVVEGNSVKKIPLGNKKISLVSTWDFVKLYERYIKVVDYVIFPSEFIAEKENKISDKNLYLGSPKYDVKLDKQEILKKYNIKTKKNALIIYPNFPSLVARCGHKKIKLIKIYGYLRKMGYNVIVKARGKAPAVRDDQGDKYVEDFSWFPHDTMELIEACDIVIISGSATAKECIMLDQPFIDFPIALTPVNFGYLYNYDYCRILSPDVKFEEFNKSVIGLLSNDYTDEFKKARRNHLFEKENVSKRILDSVL